MATGNCLDMGAVGRLTHLVTLPILAKLEMACRLTTNVITELASIQNIYTRERNCKTFMTWKRLAGREKFAARKMATVKLIGK